MFAKLLKGTTSFFMSVCPRGTTRPPLDTFSRNFISGEFFKNLSGKFKFHWSLIWITDNFHEDQLKFRIVSGWILLRTRNVSDKRCTETDYILITNLMNWLLFIHKILFSSTCFEPQVLIFRRIQLYSCSIWHCHSLCEFLVACRYTAWVRVLTQAVYR